MEKEQVCLGSATCLTCPLFEAQICKGCGEDYQKRCLKNTCTGECACCGGGKKATVPACCGRSVYRDEWIKVFNIPIRDYAPYDVQITTKLIPVIIPQVAKYAIPELFPQIDAWAVPVHRVMNLSGKFRAVDLKDYLGLPQNRKLILSTCSTDDFMEMLWYKTDAQEFLKHNIDYWFPAHYSIYDNDSIFYQYVSARRQQLHACITQSQFAWFRLGEKLPIEYLAPMKNARAVLISCQQMYSAQNNNILEQEIKIADGWFPANIDFYFIGRPRFEIDLATRKAHFINQRWLMSALFGRGLSNEIKSQMSKREILYLNLKEVLHESANQ